MYNPYIDSRDNSPVDPRRIFVGRVFKEPEVRQTSTGKKVTSFSIVYGTEKDDKGQKKSHYLNVSCWNDIAAYAENLEKGDVVLISGRLELDEYWTNRNNGEKQYKMTAEFISVQQVVGGEPGSDYVAFGSSNTPPKYSGGFESLEDDEDGLPFND